MSYMKAGIDDFRRMRDDYKRQAQQIDETMRFLDSSLRSSIWEGQAKNRFESDWNSTYKPNLQRLQQALTDCSTELEQRRAWTEQFETSRAAG